MEKCLNNKVKSELEAGLKNLKGQIIAYQNELSRLKMQKPYNKALVKAKHEKIATLQMAHRLVKDGAYLFNK